MSRARSQPSTPRRARRAVLRGANQEQVGGVVVELRAKSQRQKADAYESTIGLLRAAAADPHLIAAAEAGTIVYDGNAARTCLAAIFASCARSLVMSNRDAPAACDEMFSGTIAAGGPCGLHQECSSQQCSNPNCTVSGTPVGTCVGDSPAVQPAVGESCQPNAGCIASYCDDQTLTCTALLGAGATCTLDNQCQLGLACRGTCRALAAEGSACELDDDCKSIGNYCGPSKTCVAFGLAGASCQGNLCASAYRCDSTTSQCVLRPELGEPCSAPLDCIDQSYCDPTTSACVALLADGATCNEDAQCASGTCLYPLMSSTATCVTLVCI